MTHRTRESSKLTVTVFLRSKDVNQNQLREENYSADLGLGGFKRAASRSSGVPCPPVTDVWRYAQPSQEAPWSFSIQRVSGVYDRGVID